MVKECWLEKKEWEIRTCFKCNKKEHIAKYYKGKQMIKKQKIQEELEDENDKKEEGFGDDLK